MMVLDNSKKRTGQHGRNSNLIKYVVRMMTNTDNVESSLPTSNLLKICSLYNFSYKLHM